MGSRADGGETVAAIAAGMGEVLAHRGPDSGGVWADPEQGIALAHRRLSVIDLSPAGDQPMVSSCGLFVLSYNGEIYNADELRPLLEAKGRRFRGHSDTEVIVEACAVWGIAATLERLIGMFALALWDRAERRLVLVRDRLGIKPLYWGHWRGCFLFGSEITALRRFPGFAPGLDPAAIAGFLRFGYVPSPQAIYKGFHKLAPGCHLTVEAGKPAAIATYWSLSDIVHQARSAPSISGIAEAAEALEPILADAVARRLVSDVPLGVFLSGGIDSSLVTALIRESCAQPVRTFTIGFGEDAYNEAGYAKAIAEHLGTDHTELTIDGTDLLGVVPKLSDVYDEPFADPSQIPTYLLSRLTRREVTVALSGDGGDELFAGYNRYLWSARFASLRGTMPGFLRHRIAAALTAISERSYNRYVGSFIRKFTGKSAGYPAHKLAEVLAADSADAFYRVLISHWTPSEFGDSPSTTYDQLPTQLKVPEERMQFLDMLTFLPDDILTKVDRASMAHGLEVRVPFLDHRVVQAAWGLSLGTKLAAGKGKMVLRRILSKSVPAEMFERPKMGFGVPLDRWLREELREWAADIINATDWRGDFGLDAGPIHDAWRTHVESRGNLARKLWVVLMLGTWNSASNRA